MTFGFDRYSLLWSMPYVSPLPIYATLAIQRGHDRDPETDKTSFVNRLTVQMMLTIPFTILYLTPLLLLTVFFDPSIRSMRCDPI